MECRLFLLNDHAGENKPVVNELKKRFFVTERSSKSTQIENISDFPVLIVDIDLNSDEAVKRFQKFCKAAKTDGVPKVFVVDKAAQLSRIRLNDEDSTQTVSRPLAFDDLFDAILRAAPEFERGRLIEPKPCLEASQNSFLTLSALARVVRADKKISKRHIDKDAQDICRAVATGSTLDWLTAVNNHHSYTYRHTLHVAGLMLAFADHLGFTNRDKVRVVRGALMHDVGKAKIPTDVLDGEGPLSFKDQALIFQHPTFGLEILMNDGGWDSVTQKMVYQHHELLDGSGYPKKLSGDAISDPVRMLTIIDIFADCVDRRAGTEPVDPKTAMKKLYSMPGKVDMDFVRAFEPVALKVMEDINSVREAA